MFLKNLESILGGGFRDYMFHDLRKDPRGWYKLNRIIILVFGKISVLNMKWIP